jgi:hypothetical protein
VHKIKGSTTAIHTDTIHCLKVISSIVLPSLIHFLAPVTGLENYSEPPSDGTILCHKTESDNEEEHKIQPNLMLDLELEVTMTFDL